MNWAKTLTIICAITATLAAFQYINLMSLYKDRVEWGSFMVTQSTDVSEAKKKEVLAAIRKDEIAIISAKRTTSILFISSGAGLVLFGYFWVFRKSAQLD